MSIVKVLVRITLNLPATRDFVTAEYKAQEIIESSLADKLAVREVQMVKTESITD